MSHRKNPIPTPVSPPPAVLRHLWLKWRQRFWRENEEVRKTFDGWAGVNVPASLGPWHLGIAGGQGNRSLMQSYAEPFGWAQHKLRVASQKPAHDGGPGTRITLDQKDFKALQQAQGDMQAGVVDLRALRGDCLCLEEPS